MTLHNSDLRSKLFEQYSDRINSLDSSHNEKIHFFHCYYTKYFKKSLHCLNDKQINILDIGCNRGYLLKVLFDDGFKNLNGIDLSNSDLEIAKINIPKAKLSNSDAFEYLKSHQNSFDIIIIKAVLEHIPKNQISDLILLMKNSLKSNGKLIIDVPNMDWFFAYHERYMDFTHECGFTKESLAQVVNMHFSNFSIFTADNIFLKGFLKNARKYIVRKCIQKFFIWADPHCGSMTLWDRTLISVCEKK